MVTKGFPIISSSSLVESLRDSGYKSAASAAAELCDNSFQADASTFTIFIEEANPILSGKRGRNSGTGIERIIFSDDGKGMDPTLLRNSVRFGYSSRYNDRGGMGRFGMGLPNASISQAKTFSVYSKVKGDDWYFVSLNLDKIASGELEEVPDPVVMEPPQEYLINGGKSGTVVIWQDLDRLNLNFKSADRLESHFTTELSRIFRYFIVAGRKILIQTSKSVTEVEPFDPMYLMNEARFSGAIQHGDTIFVEAPTRDGGVDMVEVRFSLTPVEWQVSPEGIVYKNNTGDNKARRLDKNKGVSFIRAGREIDFIPADLKGPHPMNTWWSAEVSFPASVDEQFGVEFTKQRVVLTDSLRQKLDDMAFKGNAATLNQLADIRKPKEQPKVTSAPAEEIASRTKGKLRTPIATPESEDVPEQQVDELVEAVAEVRRRPEETKQDAIKRIQRDMPLLFQAESMPGAAFYRIETHGTQTFIFLNTHHSFYKKVYVPLEQAGGNALTGVQLLLFSLAQAEAQGAPDVKVFYEDERQQWSQLLTTFLRELSEQKPPIIMEEPETHQAAFI